MPELTHPSVQPVIQPEKLEDISKNDTLAIDEIQIEVDSLDEKMFSMALDLVKAGAPIALIA